MSFIRFNSHFGPAPDPSKRGPINKIASDDSNLPPKGPVNKITSDDAHLPPRGPITKIRSDDPVQPPDVFRPRHLGPLPSLERSMKDVLADVKARLAEALDHATPDAGNPVVAKLTSDDPHQPPAASKLVSDDPQRPPFVAKLTSDDPQPAPRRSPFAPDHGTLGKPWR